MRETNCTLIPFGKADITKKYIDWLNDPLVTKFSNQSYKKASFRLCKQYLDSFSGTDSLFLKILAGNSQVFIGTITANIDTRHGLADIGILIGDRNYWGKGFGLSAWNYMKADLFEKLGCRKVTGGTVAKNTAMINIMKKCFLIIII